MQDVHGCEWKMWVVYLMQRECACSMDGRVRGCMTFEWNGRWCCLIGDERGCV